MAYKTSTWAKAKANYETGNYSVADLVKMLGISDTAIENRIKREKWIKGKLKDVIELTMQQKVVKALADRKIDENTVADAIQSLLTTTDALVKDKGLTQYGKFTGSYAADKKDIMIQNKVDSIEIEVIKAKYKE